MIKKFIVVVFVLMGLTILSGCNLFGNKQTGLKLQAVSPEDLKTIYTKNHFNLLPTSIYNETLANNYNEIDYQSIIDAIEQQTNSGYAADDTITGATGTMMMSVVETDPFTNNDLYNKTDLDVLDMSKLFSASGNNAAGPVDFVYANIASVNMYMELVGKLNDEFAKYGEIKFDGTVITIPASELGTYTNPIDGTNLELNDIKAKFTKTDEKSIISVSAVNDESIDENGNSVTAEVGLYLQIAVGKTKDGIYSVEITYHVTLTASANGDIDSDTTADTANITYNMGGYIKVVDNKSININTETNSTVNVNYGGTTEDINENITAKSAFALTKGDKTEVIYKVSQNAINTFDLSYKLTADNNTAVVYMGGKIGDDDFYGEEIPAQKVAALFVYNNKNELEFVAGSADVNVTDYDYYTDTTTKTNYKYNGYGWNMNCLNGWTKLTAYAGTNPDLIGTYMIYNNDALIFGENDVIYNIGEDDNPIEIKGVGAGTANVNETTFDLAVFMHLSKNALDLSLPNGLTSTNSGLITDSYNSYIKTDKTGDAFGVDFSQAQYMVPALDKTQYPS